MLSHMTDAGRERYQVLITLIGSDLHSTVHKLPASSCTGNTSSSIYLTAQKNSTSFKANRDSDTHTPTHTQAHPQAQEHTHTPTHTQAHPQAQEHTHTHTHTGTPPGTGTHTHTGIHTQSG